MSGSILWDTGPLILSRQRILETMKVAKNIETKNLHVSYCVATKRIRMKTKTQILCGLDPQLTILGGGDSTRLDLAD